LARLSSLVAGSNASSKDVFKVSILGIRGQVFGKSLQKLGELQRV
jgi:hypothetical protein